MIDNALESEAAKVGMLPVIASVLQSLAGASRLHFVQLVHQTRNLEEVTCDVCLYLC